MTGTSISSFHRQRDEAAASLRAVAQFNAETQAQTIPQVADFLQSLVAYGIPGSDARPCQQQLSPLMNFEVRGHAHLLANDASQICSLEAPGLPPTPLTAGPWFGQVLGTGLPAVGAAELDPFSGQPAIVVAVPVKTTGRGATGSAQMDVLAAVVYTGITPLVVPTTTSPTTVLVELSADRKLILGSSATAAVHPGPTGPTGAGWLAQPRSATGRIVHDSDGITRLYQEVTGPYGWHILAGMPTSVVFGPARSELERNLALAVAVLSLVASMGILLYRRLALPIRQLQRVIEDAGADEVVRAPVDGPAEVAALAEAFNATIGQRRQLTQQLAHRAMHDPLTELPNRALLVDRLNLALSRQRRSGGWVALTFVDLDRFKQVNDTYGHPTGDRILQEFARRLRAAMRTSDTVARFGGDEFVVVSEGSGNPQGAAIAERLRECFAASFLINGRDVRLSGSIGVATGDGSSTADEMIAHADRIMYEAKQHGRRSYAMFERPRRSDQLARIEAEAELRRALAGNELLLHYQPQCRLSDSELVAVEGLVRWRHPLRGLILPQDFLPMAEETGMIHLIDEWALVAACRQSAEWRDRFGIAVPVAVNMSARQLGRTDLPAVIAGIIESTGVQPASICLEVTQGALVTDPMTTARRLTDLRALGVRLSVDDFGTAHSSLIAHLSTLPIQEIKIDGSFIARISGDAAAAALVGGVITVGHALGLIVVAEGVETSDQFTLLREMDCDVAQGNYLSPPLPAEDLTPNLVRTGGTLGRFPVPAQPAVAPTA